MILNSNLLFRCRMLPAKKRCHTVLCFFFFSHVLFVFVAACCWFRTVDSSVADPAGLEERKECGDLSFLLCSSVQFYYISRPLSSLPPTPYRHGLAPQFTHLILLFFFFLILQLFLSAWLRFVRTQYICSGGKELFETRTHGNMDRMKN